jgi:hypothetical protein
MTIFIAHAPSDAAAAEALEALLERRGQFVERDDGQTALRPFMPSDAMVLLVSSDLTSAPMRLRLVQRALDAWAERRLILVKLDAGLAPIGLRDLPAIDAIQETQRDDKWQEVAEAIGDRLRPASAEAAPRLEAPAPAKGGGVIGALMLALAIPGALALAATGAIWLANRIGPAPGGWESLLTGVEDFGARYGLPGALTPWVFALAIAIMLVVLSMFAARLKASPRVRAKTPAPMEQATAPQTAAGDQVFVSYARANQAVVLPVIEGAKQAGRKFWLDQQGLSVGEGWAGEIVRAIRGAAGVVVMCSKAAFESDHVKREVYLADRYRRKLIPVYIEDAAAPEDFEYFFAGVQHVKLYETPESERAKVLAAALGAAA